MVFCISPRTSFRVLRIVGNCMGFLTLSDSEREKNIKFNYLYWFCLINFLFLLAPTLYGLHENRKNFFAASYSWLEVSAYIEAMTVLILSQNLKSYYENLIFIPEDLLNEKIPKTVKRYASFYATVYSIIILCYAVAVIIYFIVDKPGNKDKMLITTAVYPFEIKSILLKILLLLNQFFVISSTIIIPYYDGLVIFLIFMCIYRLKVLQDHYCQSISKADFKLCIEEHVNTLNIVYNTNHAVCYMVLRIILSFFSNLFASGLQILQKSSPSENMHLYVILILAFARIYVIAESAENMTSVSKDISDNIFSTEWYFENPEMVKIKTMIICRCQNLPVISVGGIKAVLNRKYLKAIISTSFSYLMALKTITDHK